MKRKAEALAKKLVMFQRDHHSRLEFTEWLNSFREAWGKTVMEYITNLLLTDPEYEKTLVADLEEYDNCPEEAQALIDEVKAFYAN